MNTKTFDQAHASDLPMNEIGRKLLCAVAACALTVVLLGAVGESPAQAAERAAAEQAIGYVTAA